MVNVYTLAQDMANKLKRSVTKEELEALRYKLGYDRQGAPWGMSLVPWRNWNEPGETLERYTSGNKNYHDHIPRRK